MWKYVSRRIRDTIERSVNHFDKRSSAGVVNSSSNFSDELKTKHSDTPCRWFCARKCWDSFDGENNTNNKRWSYEHLNRTWIGAISWSSALVLGWYTSQLIHLKLKYSQNKEERKRYLSIYDLFTSLHPYVKKQDKYLNPPSKIERIISNFTPTVQLVSNDHNDRDRGSSSSTPTSSVSTDSSDDLGEVLNSIENKLGLAAIENGQHQDGLNMLRSAANRNHAPAMYNLGLCYETGLGVTADEKTAMELYKAAAALQHPGALYNLGIYYGQGRGGLHRDLSMATRLLRLAAVQGQKEAIEALKTLDVTLTEQSSEEEDMWNYRYAPCHESIIPTHTTLFVENVEYLQSR